MAYKYTFDPVAATEYEDAFNWYEQQNGIAGDNLIVVVQDAIAAICANPYRYRNLHKNLRELTLKKYPYNLIYFIDENKKLLRLSRCIIISVIPGVNMINRS